MGRPHPVALRERAVALVGEGRIRGAAAGRLGASIRFVDDMVRLERGPLRWRRNGRAFPGAAS